MTSWPRVVVVVGVMVRAVILSSLPAPRARRRGRGPALGQVGAEVDGRTLDTVEAQGRQLLDEGVGYPHAVIDDPVGVPVPAVYHPSAATG